MSTLETFFVEGGGNFLYIGWNLVAFFGDTSSALSVRPFYIFIKPLLTNMPAKDSKTYVCKLESKYLSLESSMFLFRIMFGLDKGTVFSRYKFRGQLLQQI